MMMKGKRKPLGLGYKFNIEPRLLEKKRMSKKKGDSPRNLPCPCGSGLKFKKCGYFHDNGYVKLEDGSWKYVGFVKKVTDEAKLGLI